MNDLDKKILDQICTKNICPKSKNYFLVLKCLQISTATALVVIASIVLALELYIIKALREEAALTDTIISRFLNAATLGTFIIAGLSLALSIILIRSMGRSYLYTVTSVAVFAGALSIILAHAFDITGINKKVDDFVMGSYLEPLIYHEYDIWMQPESGKLAGTIETVLSTSSYALRDLNNNLWIIEDFQNNKATGTKLKLHGSIKDRDPITMEALFYASETKMWR